MSNPTPRSLESAIRELAISAEGWIKYGVEYRWSDDLMGFIRAVADLSRFPSPQPSSEGWKGPFLCSVCGAFCSVRYSDGWHWDIRDTEKPCTGELIPFDRRASKAPEGREELQERVEQLLRKGVNDPPWEVSKHILSLLGSNESAGLRQAIEQFIATRGKHEGEHCRKTPDAPDGMTHRCAQCEESYVEAEAKLDAALSSRSDGKSRLRELMDLCEDEDGECVFCGYPSPRNSAVGGRHHAPDCPYERWYSQPPLPPPPASPQEGPEPEKKP